MVSAIYQGFLIGIGLALLIGPVFFALVNTSISKGRQLATYLAVGIALSDIFYIFLSYIGVSTLLSNNYFKYWLGIVGALILVVFGIQSVLKKAKLANEVDLAIDPKNKFKNVLKGFVLNSMHPGVVLFWVATVGGIISKSDFTANESYVLFTTTILTTFSIDLLKIKLASMLRGILTVSFIRKLNIVIGVILILCGVVLAYSTIMGKSISH